MQTIRTLIVDDEPKIRRGIERLVLSCGEGWEVAAAVGDGREALEFLQASGGGIDLLITDVRMPEMDGLTLIQEAKKRCTFYPMLISGYDDFAYVQTALREGAVDYLLKPVDREQFRTRMAEVRAAIEDLRRRERKWGELERDAGKLKASRQTQVLSIITAADTDLTRLGYWVEDFPKGAYALFCIRMDPPPVKTRTYTAKDWQAYHYALENIIGEVVLEHAKRHGRQAWSWKGTDSDYWTLLLGPESEWELDAEAEGLAAGIRTAVSAYTPFTVLVAYGKPIADLYLLPEAKRQALHLLHYRFIHGGNRLFGPLSEDSGGLSGEQKVPELLAAAQRVKRSVEMADSGQAAETISRFFDGLRRLASPAHMNSAVQNLLILIHSAGLESRGSLAEASPLERRLDQVRKAASLHELKLQVSRFAQQVIRNVRQSREAGSMKPVELAKDWIRERLGEELTIKKIADHVHMNPTYFSEYFKMQTGETILDYLTGERIERAKMWLRDPQLKLRDVCERVGYQDVKYFSRLFKQRTGMTPSQFRERIGVHGGGESGHGNE